jgi:hypothetical protein
MYRFARLSEQPFAASNLCPWIEGGGTLKTAIGIEPRDTVARRVIEFGEDAT